MQMLPGAEHFLTLPLYPRHFYAHSEAMAKRCCCRTINSPCGTGRTALLLVPMVGKRNRGGGRRTMAKLREWEKAGNPPGLRIMFFPYWDVTQRNRG